MPFEELECYLRNDHFFLTPKQDLSMECNAPKNSNGIYLVFELKRGKIELVYIGSSGIVLNSGAIKNRRGGLYDRIVNGVQFGKSRNISWPEKLINENIDGLDVYWYETYNSKQKDIPKFVEYLMLQNHLSLNGVLPRWNKQV